MDDERHPDHTSRILMDFVRQVSEGVVVPTHRRAPRAPASTSAPSGPHPRRRPHRRGDRGRRCPRRDLWTA